MRKTTLVAVLLNHRPAALKGRSLVEALDIDQLRPARLRALLIRWRIAPHEMYRARPIVVFAAIGQGRADGDKLFRKIGEKIRAETEQHGGRGRKPIGIAVGRLDQAVRHEGATASGAPKQQEWQDEQEAFWHGGR